MAEKRRGLGRGLGALIPKGDASQARPVDVLIPKEEEQNNSTDKELQTVQQDSSTNASSPKLVSVPMPEDSASKVIIEKPQNNAEFAAPMTVTTDQDLLPVPGAQFAELPIESITPNAKQPRQIFDEEELTELASSISTVGVLQPIVVRPAGTDSYELIMGERRWRAAKKAGLTAVPAIIRETDDTDLLRDALLENLHRAQLNPLEEAAAYQQLLDDFSCTHEQLADKIARSRPQISNTLRLLKLPPLVQRRVAAGVLSAGHARALLGLSDGGAMERLAQRIVAEGMSVRATEEVVAMDGGEDTSKKRKPRKRSDRPEELDNLEARLADYFDTRVRVTMGKRKGRVSIDFASREDLNRILKMVAPKDPGLSA